MFVLELSEKAEKLLVKLAGSLDRFAAALDKFEGTPAKEEKEEKKTTGKRGRPSNADREKKEKEEEAAAKAKVLKDKARETLMAYSEANGIDAAMAVLAELKVKALGQLDEKGMKKLVKIVEAKGNEEPEEKTGKEIFE